MSYHESSRGYTPSGFFRFARDERFGIPLEPPWLQYFGQGYLLIVSAGSQSNAPDNDENGEPASAVQYGTDLSAFPLDQSRRAGIAGHQLSESVSCQ